MRELRVSGRRVADDTGAYVIAEIGHNHGGSLATAEELVRQAAAAGAHAVKLQKRDNRRLFTRAMYGMAYEGRNSYGATYGAHREALELSRSSYLKLGRLASQLGLDFFATAFDHPSVDFLIDLDVPAIKIASADITNTPLLSYAAKTERVLIVSTGGASMADVRRACDVVLPINSRLALLQCTAIYPAEPSDLHLSVIGTYRTEFPEAVIGYSGHDLGPELSWVAFALGARFIEKHFTLDRSSRGSDHHFSLDPTQLVRMTTGLERTRRALGSCQKVRDERELPAIRKMGKKLVAARDLEADHVLTERDVACKSPGDGLYPYQLVEVLGRRLQVGLERDEDVRLDVLDA